MPVLVSALPVRQRRIDCRRRGSRSPLKTSRILLEISLLDSAYQRAGTSDDALVTTARRYRVDVEKLRDKIAAEFVAKRTKQGKSKAAAKKSAVA